MIDTEKSDLHDVLDYIEFVLLTVTRLEHVSARKTIILKWSQREVLAREADVSGGDLLHLHVGRSLMSALV